MRIRYVTTAVLMSSALFLTGCASGGDTETATESTVVTPSIDASTIDVLGGDTSTWSPEIISQGESEVFKGQFLVLDLPEIPDGKDMNVFTSDDNIVSLTQVGPDAYAVIEARELGEATVTVYFHNAGETPKGEADTVFDVKVTPFTSGSDYSGKVFDDTPALGADPETWTPVNIDPSQTVVNLVVNQYAIIETAPITTYDEGIEVVSSDPKVVAVVELVPNDFGLIQAESVGSTVITVEDTDEIGVFMTVKVNVSAR